MHMTKARMTPSTVSVADQNETLNRSAFAKESGSVRLFIWKVRVRVRVRVRVSVRERIRVGEAVYLEG